MNVTHGKKCLQQLHQRCHVVPQKVLCCLQLQTPDLVSEPNFVATVNLVANLFVVEHHEKVEQDHMVGSCLGYQRVEVMKKFVG